MSSSTTIPRSLIDRAFTIPNTQRIIRFAATSLNKTVQLCYVSSIFQETMFEHETVHFVVKHSFMSPVSEIRECLQLAKKGAVNAMMAPIASYTKFCQSNVGKVRKLFVQCLRINCIPIAEQLLDISPKREQQQHGGTTDDQHESTSDFHNDSDNNILDIRKDYIQVLFHAISTVPFCDAASHSPQLFHRMLEVIDELDLITYYLHMNKESGSSLLAHMTRNNPRPECFKSLMNLYSNKEKVKMSLKELFSEEPPSRAFMPYGAEKCLYIAIERDLNVECLKILIEDGYKRASEDEKIWKKALMETFSSSRNMDLVMVACSDNLNVESLRLLLLEFAKIGRLEATLRRITLNCWNCVTYACRHNLNFDSFQLLLDTLEKVGLLAHTLVYYSTEESPWEGWNALMFGFLMLKDMNSLKYLVEKYRTKCDPDDVQTALTARTELRRDCLLLYTASASSNATSLQFSLERLQLLLSLYEEKKLLKASLLATDQRQLVAGSSPGHLCIHFAITSKYIDMNSFLLILTKYRKLGLLRQFMFPPEASGLGLLQTACKSLNFERLKIFIGHYEVGAHFDKVNRERSTTNSKTAKDMVQQNTNVNDEDEKKKILDLLNDPECWKKCRLFCIQQQEWCDEVKDLPTPEKAKASSSCVLQ